MVRSFYAKYRAIDGGWLIGGEKTGQSCRFGSREGAETRLQGTIDINGAGKCAGEVVESDKPPEIFAHCGTMEQAIGGKCFGCGKVLTAVDAKAHVATDRIPDGTS